MQIKDLVYFWNSNMRIGSKKGTSITGKYKVNYNEKENWLKIEGNDDYLDGFWGKNVQNCFALVGDNGAGKSTLMISLMEIIQNIKYGSTENEMILVVEEETEGKLYIYCSDSERFHKIKIKNNEKNISYEIVVITEDTKYVLNELEVAYFNNALNYNDYFCDTRCKYDFSLGKTINNCRNITFEMHYDDLNKDIIKNYYDSVAFRIVNFLYQYGSNEDLQINFPVPNIISIKIEEEQYIEDYIINGAKGIRVDRDKEVELSEKINLFKLALDNFTKVFGRTWSNYTIKYLILNCFKDICLPQVVPSKKGEEYKIFFEACNFMRDEKKIRKCTPYDCAIKIISEIKKRLGENLILEESQLFIEWIRYKKEEIVEYENSEMCYLEIPTNNKTKDFMKEILEHYSRLNFTFPFWKFSFGVSTGEYSFLSIFSNLYSMVGDNYIYAYDYPKIESKIKMILLIFDEADLSLHPKWQRMYMKWLIDFCEKLFSKVNIKIIITTHSPFLLSDFPNHSVLYLRNEEGEIFCSTHENNTFGCNIHTLFLDSFFLSDVGTMGAFAEDKINGIIKELFENGAIASCELEEMEKIIGYIGESIIKDKLRMAFNQYGKKKNPPLVNNDTVKKVLSELKSQRKYLDKTISSLEDMVK